MFVYKKAKSDSGALREAQTYSGVATTAALMFAYFAAIRIAQVLFSKYAIELYGIINAYNNVTMIFS